MKKPAEVSIWFVAIVLIALVVFIAVMAHAQTTTTMFTGTIKGLDNLTVPSGKIVFTLKPPIDTTISGGARFTASVVNCKITAGGIEAWDGVSACMVTKNTSLMPNGTYYQIDICPYSACPSNLSAFAIEDMRDISTLVPTPVTSPGYDTSAIQALTSAFGWYSVKNYGAKCDGVTDDTDSINQAIDAALTTGGGTVYFPAGLCYYNGAIRLDVASSGFHSDWNPKGIEFRGDGPTASYLVQNNPTSTLITVVKGKFSMQNMSLLGRGNATTGNLMELFTTWVSLRHATFQGTAGRCLLQGLERLYVEDAKFINCRQAIVQTSAANNESYYRNIEVLDPGLVRDPITRSGDYNYNRNTVAGVFPASGAIDPDYHAAIVIGQNAVNNLFEGGSIKALGTTLAGMRIINGENIKLSHLYFEGYWRPAYNPSILFGGVHETTTTTQSMAARATQVSVADAKWFTNVIGSTLDVARVTGDGTYSLILYPPDYDPSSSAASTLGNGILKNDWERVAAQAFVNNVLYIQTRGVAGTGPKAWPAGTVVNESQGRTKTPADPIVLEDDHIEGHGAGAGGSSYTPNCDPDNKKPCAEIVLGFMPDAFHRTSGPGAMASSWRGLLLKGNTRMRHGAAGGEGIIQVYLTGSDITMDRGNATEPKTSTIPYGGPSDGIQAVTFADATTPTLFVTKPGYNPGLVVTSGTALIGGTDASHVELHGSTASGVNNLLEMKDTLHARDNKFRVWASGNAVMSELNANAGGGSVGVYGSNTFDIVTDQCHLRIDGWNIVPVGKSCNLGNGAANFGSAKFNDPIYSLVPTGTAPFRINSTSWVQHLNADMVDNVHAGNVGIGHAMCWKDSTHMGYCSDTPAADGTCTCK